MSFSSTASTMSVRARLLRPLASLGSVAGVIVLGVAAGCSSRDTAEARLATQTDAEPATVRAASTDPAEPPAAIRAWMDRLTVAHHYDPATGFIVADEVIDLPAVLRRAPDARTLVDFGREQALPVVVFATANRCAPCQQYKRDALRDPEVIILLESGDLMATHLEVDQSPDMAREVLGSTSIPMTYLIRDGRVVDRLSGQRSAAELRDWLRRAVG